MAREGSELSEPEVIYPPLVDGANSRALVTSSPASPRPAPAPGFAPRGPEILHGGFNQTWLAHCLRRRWLLATLMGLLVGSLFAGLMMWLFPESSRITSYLQVQTQEESPFEEKSRPLSPAEIQRELMNHLALIHSPLVIEAVLQRRDISQLEAVQKHGDDAMKWLIDELKVSFPNDGEVLEVRYEGEEDPDEMVKLVDTIVESYIEKVLLKDRMTMTTTKDDLRAVLTQIKKDLNANMTDYQKRAEITGYANFEDFVLPKLRTDIQMIQGQLAGIAKELEDVEVLKDVAVNIARSPAALDSAVQLELDKDPTLALYQQQLFELDRQITELSSLGRNPNNADLRRRQGQRQQLQFQMEAYRQQAEKQARERLAKVPNEALRSAMVEYQVRRESINARKIDLETRLADAEKKIAQMASGDPELEMLEQEIEGQRELVANLEQSIAQWDVMQRSQEGRNAAGSDKVRIIQPAMASEQINKYERWAIAGVGGLAALCLTAYGIALLEFRHRRLNGPNDMDEGLGIRVLGVLPPTSLKALVGNSITATQVAEAIDNVRATIMHDSTKRPRQVVMVTSPASMEGSTTVASSLALSLARAGRRTLLIDGDLRAPTLHKLFGMALEDGLCEVLRSEIDLADAIRPTNSEGLYLLPAGVCDMDSIHALATDQPQAVFEKLRDQFDFVVIDAPPVLGISDALSLGQYVDGAVLTVLRDHSEVRKIYQAVEVLRSLGIRLIGTVVNAVPVKADRRIARLHQASASRQPRLPAEAES